MNSLSEQAIIFGILNVIGHFFTFQNPVTKGKHSPKIKILSYSCPYEGFQFKAAFLVTMQCLSAVKKALTKYEEKLKTVQTSSLTAVLDEGFALTELTSQG